MKHLGIVFALVSTLISQPAAPDDQVPTPEQQQFMIAAKELWDSLDRRHGEINLSGNLATLNVPENFYYLGPTDTEKVLVKVWGNPPGSGQDTLGMLFPAETTPFDQGSWGVTIAYQEDGYVSDEDADKLDYDELLSQMKEATREAGKERAEQGYGTMELVGWASEPHYDRGSHKMYWAKEMKFGDAPANTLNYSIRILGRKGVLILNFIAGMEQKEMIDSNVDTVMAMAEFDQGSQYEDFDPSIDKVAAYGIGALVAGKVLAKTGLIAAALVFLKKFGVLIVIGVGVFLGKFFRRKKPQQA